MATKQRNLLKTWLIKNTTGGTRIRAGTPKEWIVGDKTGTCAYGTTNDIGIIWPPRGAPIVLAVYYTQDQENSSPNDAVIVSVAQIILKAYSSQNRAKKFSNSCSFSYYSRNTRSWAHSTV